MSSSELVNWCILNGTPTNWRFTQDKLMHVNSEKKPVESRVQGQFTVICKIFQVVQIMHAIRYGPMFGLHSFGIRISQLNMV